MWQVLVTCVALTAVGCEFTGLAGPTPRTEGVVGAGDASGRDPVETTPRSDPLVGAGSGDGDAKPHPYAPYGGVQRVWAWYNPGTTSSDIDGQRGIALDKSYRVLEEGGWGDWIDRTLAPLGYPPVVLRAPFGTSRWTNRSGDATSAFRYEDAIDVQRDPKWAWIASEAWFVEPWARYRGPVAFHVGTADDRLLTDEELRLGVKPFIRVKEERDRLRNREPVCVVLDHSQWFDDKEVEPRESMTRRQALQTSRAVWLLTEAGVEVLTEAVPHVDTPPAAYWADYGTAFRPHLSKVRRVATPMALDAFQGLVLAWLMPADFRDDGMSEFQRRRRVIESTREYGNVAVPPFAIGGKEGWADLMLHLRREPFAEGR
ncbi:MAG: hypothetical protein AAGI53_13450 [Planctomycetota bacterium]